MPADAVLADTIPIPSLCLACGAEGTRESGVCPRCGLTDGDTRGLLRSAADAYAVARLEASRGRYDAAQRSLAVAAALGLSTHPAVVQLQRISTFALAPVSESELSAYTVARAAAASGRYSEAMQASAIGDGGSPYPRELLRLSREGARQRANVRRREAIAGVTASLLFAGLAWKALSPPRRSGAPRPIPTPTPASVQTARVLLNAKASPAPPAPRTDQIDSEHYPYPERLARRYYNDAMDARRSGHYKDAARLADAAAITGKDTYIVANALLLRAEIADTIRERDSAARWAKIAASAPDSPYAPLGLLRAAMRVQTLTGDTRDARPYLLELLRRYSTSKEAASARKRFGPFPE